MKLKDLSSLDVVSCARDTSIAAAARSMREHHTGDLVVIDDGDAQREPVGIVTDRDIAIEVVARGRDPDKTRVDEIMSSHLVIASESEELEQALERMTKYGVRRIPVVDDSGSVTGIIALDDILRAHVEQATRIMDVISKEQDREHRTKR